MNTDKIITALAEVEEGFALVLDADTNRRIGQVVREKVGSTRTGIAWFAYRNGRKIGQGYTRTEAVAIVAEHTAIYRAKLEALRTAK
jgi:hypothetical protein